MMSVLLLAIIHMELAYSLRGDYRFVLGHHEANAGDNSASLVRD